MPKDNPKWWIYQGTVQPHDKIDKLPEPPPWRLDADETRGTKFQLSKDDEDERQIIEMVNAALYLRRPLLITGMPGVGKTSLAYAVAHELNLGKVQRWSITTNSKLKDGLYSYDAIARLQDTSLMQEFNLGKVQRWSITTNSKKQGRLYRYGTKTTPPDISKYLRLGPLGTAFAAQQRPRVLLIDEIDKSDIDLPNDLLHIFEEGKFEIPELARLPKEEHAISPCDDGEAIPIKRGKVCVVRKAFPLVIMTSNEEREFPPAFLRRCLQLKMRLPDDKNKLAEKFNQIITAHLSPDSKDKTQVNELINEFINKRESENGNIATDQLLNAVFLILGDSVHQDKEILRDELRDALWKPLSSIESYD